MFDPGALLGRTYELPGGRRARLRLARPSDREALGALLGRSGLEAGELELRRALNVDPRRRVVLAAVAPNGRREELLGFGGMERDGEHPDLLVGPGEPAVRELLASALRARAGHRHVA